MSKKSIPSFNTAKIKEVGVVSLAIRPNQSSQYGVGGLTGKQLQERFDLLAKHTIEHLNEVIKILNSNDVASYISLGERFENYGNEDRQSLSDFIKDVYTPSGGLVVESPDPTKNKESLKAILEELYNFIIALNAYTKISEYITDDPEATLDDIFAKLSTLETHNKSEDSHPLIIEALGELLALLDSHTTDEEQLAHQDIRDSVDAVEESFESHKTDVTAHGNAIDAKISTHNTSGDAHQDIRTAISEYYETVVEFMNTVATLLDSDDETLNQTSEIIAVIKENKDLIASITTNKVNVSDIVNNLTSTDTNKPLSAYQGKVLNEKFNDYALKYPISDAWKHNYAMLFLLMNTKKNGNYQYEKTYVSPSEAVQYGIPRRDGEGKIVAHDHVKNSSPSYYVSSKELASALDDLRGDIGSGGGSGGSGGGTGGPYITQTDLEQALQAFKNELDYKSVQVSLSVSPTVAEKGSTVNSVTLSWNVMRGVATELLLNDKEDVTNITSKTITKTGTWKSNTTFKLMAEDAKGAIHTSHAYLNFYNGVFYGCSTNAHIETSSDIRSLTRELADGPIGTMDFNAALGEFIYYCQPVSYGTCVFKDESPDAGGLPYGFDDPWVVYFENASGYKENYYVYRSSYALAGTAKITATRGDF